MHAKNDLRLDKPHEMGACILTFESINKDNPLATNQTIVMIANVFENVHAPIDISSSISNFFQNMDINVQHFSNAILLKTFYIPPHFNTVVVVLNWL